MLKYYHIIFSFNCFSQVTVVLKEIPKNTPKEASIYISGDFEGWTGGNEKHKLKRNNSSYSITLPKKGESVLFKFTLGSWKTAESNTVGESLDNRSYNFTSKHDTIYYNVQGWSHLFEVKL